LQVNRLIDDIARTGFGVEAATVPGGVSMPNESDRKFYDVARTTDAILITGNTKHYPDEPFLLTSADFVQRCYSEE
jgi:hypothetical protein